MHGERAEDASGAVVWPSKVVLPKPYDCPACGGQRAFDLGVAVPITAEFGKPVGAVGGRLAAVLWTAVPEAAVNENGKALAAEHKIGAAGERLVPTPAGDASGAKGSRQF